LISVEFCVDLLSDGAKKSDAVPLYCSDYFVLHGGKLSKDGGFVVM